MTLENIYYIGQTIAVLAIIGSLIAVLIQMRQTNRLLRNQAKRDQIDSIKSLSEWLLQTPGLADMMIRANNSGLESLTEAERAQIFAYLMVAQRTWESMYVQYKDGQIDADLWRAHLEQARAAWQFGPVIQEFWKVRRHLFTADYQAYHDAEMTRDSDVKLYGERNAEPKPETATP